jgi:ribosomal protein S17
MSRIEKKMWPESYEKVLSGEKTYDIRLADWTIEPGDTIVFREWDPSNKKYTGRIMQRKVGYVGKTKDWEVWPKEDIEKYGFQVISLIS